jgi:hypothetical protein
MSSRLPGMPIRWVATVTYRTQAGPLAVEHDIEELRELQNLIERGPDWNTIASIEIILARPTNPDLTIEHSQEG